MTATLDDTSADAKRQWARDHGFRVGERGRLPKDAEDAWQREHSSYDGGVSEADFLEADEPPEAPESTPGAGPDDDTEQAEERPQRPGRPRAKARWRFRMPTASGTTSGTKKPRKSKAPRKWLSVRHLIEDAWGELGWAAKPIPPLSRMFYAQAPIAGVVLEPAIKGTLPDRLVLQPMARNYEKYKAVMGLMGPPAALMGVLATQPRPQLDAAGMPVMRPVIQPDTGQPAMQDGQPVLAPVYVNWPPSFEYKTAMVMLRYSVGVMVDAAGGENIQRITQRAVEREEREERINEFLSFILGMPVQPMP